MTTEGGVQEQIEDTFHTQIIYRRDEAEMIEESVPIADPVLIVDAVMEK